MYLRCLVALALGAAPLAAQDHDHHSMAGMDHGSSVSATARKQIDSVAKATRPLATEAQARSAGFRPVFGWIPTMGVHWVDQARMAKSQQSNAIAPSQLMFSKINGRDSLVGAAYGYFADASDPSRPSLFDGSPAWHEHADLAPPGQTLVMLHVWFVPSPDGPFAGTNPNLPFWAAGLNAPDSARMHDPAFAARVRRASLALAEVTDTTSIFPNLEQRPELKPILAAHRDSIRALIPEFTAAEKAHDNARWDRTLDKAAGQWDAIDAAYMGSVRTPAIRARMEKFVDMLLGKHGEG